MDNCEQREIYTAILDAVEEANSCTRDKSKPTCFFIDGPAGTGKSYLLNGLIKNLKVLKYNVLPNATTGIAADLLEGGRTVHSRFKIPLFIDKENELDVSADSFLGKSIIESNIIIIDEVSAMNKTILVLINKLLMKLMRKGDIFGGKVMVLSGDFRQTLPIIEGVSSEIIITDASLLKLPLFT